MTNGQGYWNDVSCTSYMSALCKRPAQHEYCDIAGPDRQECGFPGIQANECIGYGCCWTPLDGHYWCFHPKNSAQCENSGDPTWDNKCVDNSVVDERTCSRGADSTLCANTGIGGQDQTCCMHCSTATCKNEEAAWASQDTDCIMKGGGCQFTSINCKGGKTFHPEFTCGGPVDRQCCAPNSPPPSSTSQSPTVPTIPPDDVPVDPNAGGGSGKTAGVVIGVMFAIVVVLGGGFYVKQNGIPFVAAQQSFTNLNSSNNDAGITDGISNPLGDGDDDDNSNGGAIDEPIAVAVADPVVTVTEPANSTAVGGFDDFLNQPSTETAPSSTGLDSFADLTGGPAAQPATDQMTTVKLSSDNGLGGSLL